MGSTYVSPVSHVGGEIHVNLCSPTVKHLYSVSSSDKKLCIVTSKKGVNIMGCSHLHLEYAHSLSSSSSLVFSSPTVNMALSSSNLMANIKSFIKFRRNDCKPRCIPNTPDHTPIEAIQSSSATPIELHHQQSASNPMSNSDEKAPLNLPERWREIQGEKHWEGLLDHPINAALRAEIIRYGEFAQVCYDSFDFDKHSLYCGSCKYSRRALFEKVDKGGCGYEVTKYLYATSKLDLPKFFRKSERDEEKRWSHDSNWIGYVAVCTDEAEIRRIGRRDILIAWRGTVTATEWVDDLMTTQTPANIELAQLRPCGRVLVNAPRPLHSQHANVESESCHSQPENVKLAESVDSPVSYVQPGAQMHYQSSAVAQDDEAVSKHVKADSNASNTTACRVRCAQNDDDVSEVVKVESGFLSLYSSSKASSRFNKISAGQQMAMEVKRLLQKYEGEEVSITVTGHSLGAALALLCAYDIAANLAPPPDTAQVSPNAAPTLATLSVPAAKSSSAASPSNLAAPPIPDSASFTATSCTQQLNVAGTSSKATVTGSSPNVAPPPPPPPPLKAAVPVNSASSPNVAASPKTRTFAANPIRWLNFAAAPNKSTVGASPNSSSTPPDTAAAPPRTEKTAANLALNAAAPPVTAAASRNSSPLITVFSFAGPRVGNRAFKKRVEELGVRVLRIVNVHDCVPKVPGVLFNERNLKVWPNRSCYHHVGKELLIDMDSSPHLRHTRDLPSHHNLEAHLHVLDGFHGFTRPFQSVFKRSHVLVNKSSDFLKKEAFIPPSWWQDSNKGLIKDPSSGQWVVASREDDHLPEIHHP